MKIIDAFYYNGEVDILQIRLNILSDYVDQFIVLEANQTFSGKSKISYFERDKESWKPWQHKIKYMFLENWDDEVMRKLAKDSPNTNGAFHWQQEFYNKEKLKDALVDLQDEDVVFISDCDEIWDPESLINQPIWGIWDDKIYRINQKVYCYYLNMRSNEEWAGTLLLKYGTLKDKILNHLRGGSGANHPRTGAGWHFTNQGGLEEVRRKLNDSYTIDSYNTPRTQELLKARFGRGDWLDRDFQYHIDDSELPEYLKLNREKYDRFIKKS